MKINEIFYSIQGESSFMGYPCAFIRLTSCDLRCSFCDTPYAFSEGTEMTIPQILNTIEHYPTRMALITGGEPLLQESVHELFHELLLRKYLVCVETGGQVSLKDVDKRVHKIMDFKCPSSGMSDHNLYENVEYLSKLDEVKFVVGDRADFDWACDLARKYSLSERAGTILFSPVYQKLPYAQLAGWILNCGLPVRMQLQLHRIIWPNVERGV